MLEIEYKGNVTTYRRVLDKPDQKQWIIDNFCFSNRCNELDIKVRYTQIYLGYSLHQTEWV
jgi:hypothetical protein